MRTNGLNNFLNSISKINNHFSHSAFVFEQFKIDSAQRIENEQQSFTTKVFAENQYAPQFEVRLNQLAKQAEETKNFLTDSLFVFANTHFEVYLKDLFTFYKLVTGEKLGETPEKSIYNSVLKALHINIDVDLDNLLVSTFEYIKLRRNAVMHKDKKRYFQSTLRRLIKGEFGASKEGNTFRENQLNGQQLNASWKKNRETLNGKGHTVSFINFTNIKNPDFTFGELCDILNFYRLFAAHIDYLVLQRIDRDKLLSYCKKVHQQKHQLPDADFSDENVWKKFKRTCIFELGFEPLDSEIEVTK